MLDNKLHVAKWCHILMVEPEVQGSSPLGGGEACYICFFDKLAIPQLFVRGNRLQRMPIKAIITWAQDSAHKIVEMGVGFSPKHLNPMEHPSMFAKSGVNLELFGWWNRTPVGPIRFLKHYSSHTTSSKFSLI